AREQFVQWEGPFADGYKIHPRLQEMMRDQADPLIDVAVQIAGATGAEGGPAGDVKAARRLASAVLLDAHSVMNFTNLRLTVSASKITELAALANVVNVEPWTAPRLFDERSAQVVAGQLAKDFKG